MHRHTQTVGFVVVALGGESAHISLTKKNYINYRCENRFRVEVDGGECDADFSGKHLKYVLLLITFCALQGCCAPLARELLLTNARALHRINILPSLIMNSIIPGLVNSAEVFNDLIMKSLNRPPVHREEVARSRRQPGISFTLIHTPQMVNTPSPGLPCRRVE